jgi:hypothetical protein
MQTLKQANEARRIEGMASFDIITTSLPCTISEVTRNGIYFETDNGRVFVTSATINQLKAVTDAAGLYGHAEAK